MSNPEYHNDGQCDYIAVRNLHSREWRIDDFRRCPAEAKWQHNQTSLCYCEKHTSYYEGKIEAGWKPI